MGDDQDDYVNLNSQSLNELSLSTNDQLSQPRRSSLPLEFNALDQDQITEKFQTFKINKRDHSAPKQISITSLNKSYNTAGSHSVKQSKENIDQTLKPNAREHFENSAFHINTQIKSPRLEKSILYQKDSSFSEYINVISDSKSVVSVGSKEVTEHFMRKNENEVNRLRNENFHLKNLINSFRKTAAITATPTSNASNDKNLDAAHRQLHMLKEELVRVKLQLEQSQVRRISEMKQRRSTSNLARRSDLTSPENTLEKSYIEENAHLLSEISTLRAAENVLKSNLDNEVRKNASLTIQIQALQQKLHAYELSDMNAQTSSSPTSVTKSVTTVSKSVSNATKADVTATVENTVKNETLYYEILTKLKSEGFDNTTNYQDLIISLYQQRTNTVNQMNALLYYMKELNMNCEEPEQGLRDVFDELKSNKREIDFMNEKNESLKLELKYQQREYTKQIKHLLSEREILLNHLNQKTIHQQHQATATAAVGTKTVIYPITSNPSPTNAQNANSKIDGYRYKVVYNINSRQEQHESLIEQQKQNIMTESGTSSTHGLNDTINSTDKKNYLSSLRIMKSKSYQITDDKEQVEEEKITTFQQQQQQQQQGQNSNQQQNYQQYQHTSYTASTMTQQQQQQQIENEKQIQLLEQQINSLKTELLKANAKNESIQNENNVQYLTEQVKILEEENKRLRQEQIEYRQKHKTKSAQLKLKLEEYETEIGEVNRELNKQKIEVERLKLDLTFKIDENRKLQIEVKEYSETKMKSTQIEDKLNSEIRSNQLLQSKIDQLQQEMFNLLKIANRNEDTTLSSDRILETLKEIIKEQMAAKQQPTNTHEVDEYKHKVNELQMKLQHEKLLKESLEIKLKLIEQDNQSLRQTLLNNNRKFGNNSEKLSKTRLEEINELIEKAQINAKTMMATNPSFINLIETR